MFTGYKLDDEIIQNIYIPYLKKLKKIMKNDNLKINQIIFGKEKLFTLSLKIKLIKFCLRL